MLSADTIALIDQIVNDASADSAARLERVARLESAEALQYLATEYNWDDGLDVPAAIADHPRCDLGVALTLFWQAEAVALYTGEVEPDDYNKGWVAFCRHLGDRIIGNYYARGRTSFSVTSHYGKVRLYALKKRGIPEILINDVEGFTSDCAGR